MDEMQLNYQEIDDTYRVLFLEIEKVVKDYYSHLSAADKAKLAAAEFEFLPQERKVRGVVVHKGIRAIRYRDSRDGGAKREIPLVNCVPPYQSTAGMFADIILNAYCGFSADINTALKIEE